MGVSNPMLSHVKIVKDLFFTTILIIALYFRRVYEIQKERVFNKVSGIRLKK
jgi:hypothetical protein